MTEREKLFDYITDLLVDFDEMGFTTITACPDPEAYAIEWRRKITDALEKYHKLYENAITLPFKVGTRVAVIHSMTSNKKNSYIFEDTITHYRVCDEFTVMCFEEHRSIPRWNWDNVYASREEAETALKGVNDGTIDNG